MPSASAKKEQGHGAKVIPFRARGAADGKPAALPAAPKTGERPTLLAPALRGWLLAGLIVSVGLHGAVYLALQLKFTDDLERAAGEAVSVSSEGAVLLVPVEIVVETPLPAAPAHAAAAEEKAAQPVAAEATPELKPVTEAARTEPAAGKAEPPGEITALIEAPRAALPVEPAAAPRPAESASRPEAPAIALVIEEPRRSEPRTSEPDKQEPPRHAPREQRKAAPASPSTAAAPARPAASEAPGRAGSSGALATGGSAAASSYQAQVIAHLQRHKRYPPEAQSRGITGAATVRFALAADGRVLSASLARGSGASVLDEAAVAMVRRASPFPPFPPELARTRMDFAAPIRFDLR